MRINLITGRRRASLPLSCEGGRSRGDGGTGRGEPGSGGGEAPGAQFSKFSPLGPPALPRDIALAFHDGAYRKARVCMNMSL